MADEKNFSRKVDDFEVKAEQVTGVKGSSGNWLTSHPVVLVLVAAAFIAMIWFF